jgi:hypothetical protein
VILGSNGSTVGMDDFLGNRQPQTTAGTGNIRIDGGTGTGRISTIKTLKHVG